MVQPLGFIVGMNFIVKKSQQYIYVYFIITNNKNKLISSQSHGDIF